MSFRIPIQLYCYLKYPMLVWRFASIGLGLSLVWDNEEIIDNELHIWNCSDMFEVVHGKFPRLWYYPMSDKYEAPTKSNPPRKTFR